MLDYLVTSVARRRLLGLLWAEGARDSISALAERAELAYATAHRELKAMARAQVAVSLHEAGREVYRANDAHPGAELLRQLVACQLRATEGDQEPDDAKVRRRLKALGAPLHDEPLEVPSGEVLATLVDGVRLARRDATVARSLPVCMWNARDQLDARALQATVLGADDKHALGLFLELTTLVSDDQRFAAYAELLRDRRVRGERSFFEGRVSEAERALAQRKTPDVARRWGFWLNVDLASFRSTFDRFAHR